MKVALGADENLHVVGEIRRHLEERGHEVTAFGAAGGVAEPWAATGLEVARAVAEDRFDFGVLCCWTGTGVSIAANKVPGVRAVCAYDIVSARMAAGHDDANVVCVGGKTHGELALQEILKAFLATPFEGGRHERRLSKILSIEKKYSIAG